MLEQAHYRTYTLYFQQTSPELLEYIELLQTSLKRNVWFETIALLSLATEAERQAAKEIAGTSSIRSEFPTCVVLKTTEPFVFTKQGNILMLHAPAYDNKRISPIAFDDIGDGITQLKKLSEFEQQLNKP